MNSLRDLLIAIKLKDEATPELEKIDKKIDSVKDGFGKLGIETKTTERTTSKLSNTASKTSDNMSKLGTKTKGAKGEFSSFEDRVKSSSNKLDKIGDKMGKMGKQMTTKVTLPLLGIGAAAIKTTASFDDTMAQVKSISGASQAEFDKLRKKALQMGRDTRFSASESGEAFMYMSMAGWDAQQSLDGIEGVMSLAAASGEDLANVSDIVTDALSAFGMQAEDSAKFADLLASASANSNTNVGLLGQSFQYVAPVFGSMRYTAEDAALALGLMANSGIKGSKAGTALRSAITNLVNPTDDMAAAMEILGLSITDADGEMKPFKTVMDELREKFKGLSEGQKTFLASTIFGKEAMSGMLAIIDASDEEYEQLINSTREYSGAAQEMADINEDTIGGAFRSLASELEGAAIAIGDVMKPEVKSIAKTIKGWTKAFSELDPVTKKTIVKIGLLAMSIGPLLKVGKGLFKGASRAIDIGGKLVEHTDVIKAAFGGLGSFLKPLFGAMFTPWGLAITGAIIGGILLWRNWDTIKEKGAQLKESVQEKFANIGNWIKTTWNNAKTWANESWANMKATVSGYGESIRDKVADVGTQIKTKWNNAVTKMNEAAKNKFESIASKVESSFDRVKSAIGKGVTKLQEWNDTKIKPKIAKVTQKITTAYQSAKGKIGKHATGTNYFSGGQTIVGEKGPELVTLPRGARIDTNTEFRSGATETNSGIGHSVNNDTFAPQINISIEGDTNVKEQIPDIKKEVEKTLYPLLEEYWAQMRIKRPSMT